MRSVPEWIGKTDDEKIPDRVKLRIWSREKGRCHLSDRKIMPGDQYEFSHFEGLALGGQHRESNIGLALIGLHKIKTAEDRRQQAKDDRIRKRHAGIKKPRSITGWKNFRGEPIRASRER